MADYLDALAHESRCWRRELAAERTKSKLLSGWRRAHERAAEVRLAKEIGCKRSARRYSDVL